MMASENIRQRAFLTATAADLAAQLAQLPPGTWAGCLASFLWGLRLAASRQGMAWETVDRALMKAEALVLMGEETQQGRLPEQAGDLL